MDLDKLLELGKAVLEPSEESTDIQLEAFEAYCAAVSEWMEAHGGAENLELNQDELSKVKEFEGMHARLLAYAAELQEETRQDIIAQRARGKGIMKYVDILPKRISVMGKRKG